MTSGLEMEQAVFYGCWGPHEVIPCKLSNSYMTLIAFMHDHYSTVYMQFVIKMS